MRDTPDLALMDHPDEFSEDVAHNAVVCWTKDSELEGNGPTAGYRACDTFLMRCSCGHAADDLEEFPQECPSCGTDEVSDPDGWFDYADRLGDADEVDDDWRMES